MSDLDMFDSKLGNELIAIGQARWQALNQTHGELLAQWPQNLLVQLAEILALSDFVAESLLADADLVSQLPKYLTQSSSSTNQAPIELYRAELKQRLDACVNEDQVYQQCRSFRRQSMVIIAWRDFLISHYPEWNIEISLQHLSHLAEAMITESYHWQYKMCCQEWGTPCNNEGVAQPMLILGMGKLGGGELNFSSDIDLIFTYPENGETVHLSLNTDSPNTDSPNTDGTNNTNTSQTRSRRSIDNSVFFTRLGQRVIKTLDHISADGFCYRVDMRLRPFGDSGPLVMSYSALEDYYQEQGRDWERYAMVKARVMGADDFPQYEELRQMLVPFVFRRYIDFSAIQSLRRMKSMIQTEVRRRGLSNNIKLGAGGIREIEFIVQSFQLIRGGREPSLQLPSLFSTLSAITSLELLPQKDVDTLCQSYCFLRRLENLIQAIDDKQTQTLPDSEPNQARLAYAMNCENWAQLHQQVNQHMQNVHEVFDDLIGEEETPEKTVKSAFIEMWDAADNGELLEQIFEQELEVAFEQLHKQSENKQQADLELSDAKVLAKTLTQTLVQFQQDIHKKTLGQRGRENLALLMPKVLEAVFEHVDGEFCLSRVLSVLAKIVTRTTYLELLSEHPEALKRLVQLCTASPMISEKIGLYPMLLDELIDPRHFYEPMQLSDYQLELRDFLARIPEDDMEQQMEALRQFKQICLLKIAAADVLGVLPVMKVSDHLTYLAEAIMQAVVSQAWQQMAEKYGTPTYLQSLADQQDHDTGLIIVGYGKVGGWELGYKSDLDVICLHDCPDNNMTDGDKSIDSRQFYLRLVQRIMHIFSIRTPSGILYEIDMRLRPSGNSGLLACTLETFEHYQNNDAWTWEHQALTRARVIYGNEQISEQFQQIRQRVLTNQVQGNKPRDAEQLKQEIVQMREKMIAQLANKKPDRFHLKNDRGGITDIEFLVQYWVLRFSAQYPDLLIWSDNVRIIEQVAKQGLIPTEQAELLTQAYTQMRNAIHHKNLLNNDVDSKLSRFEAQRETVQSLWNEWLA